MLFKEILLFLKTCVLLCMTMLPGRVSYDDDVGDGTGGLPSGFVDPYDGEQAIAAGGDVAQSGICNFIAVGRKYTELEVIVAGTGNREVEVLIQYFQYENGRLIQMAADRLVNQKSFDYIPQNLLWVIPLKTIPNAIYIRIRNIFNRGDMNIIVKVKMPASAHPVSDAIEVIEREVDENVENI